VPRCEVLVNPGNDVAARAHEGNGLPAAGICAHVDAPVVACKRVRGSRGTSNRLDDHHQPDVVGRLERRDPGHHVRLVGASDQRFEGNASP
jgi:hypothetical protein